MISISKISNSFKQGKYRLFKVFQFGAKTADECSPFGFDGNPLRRQGGHQRFGREKRGHQDKGGGQEDEAGEHLIRLPFG